MNNPFTIDIRTVQRVVCVMLAALLVAAGVPLMRPHKAYAAQLQDRSITMSDSATSNTTITTGVGSGTNVTYRIQFTLMTASDSLVIDFCEEDPIIGDACTGPGGMDLSTAALATVAGESDITAAGWTLTAVNTNGPSVRSLKLARNTGNTAAAAAVTGTVHTFDITGIKNPDATACSALTNSPPACTFFARFYTYPDNDWGFTTNGASGNYDSATVPGIYTDYGGVAMSTTSVITITARVQEQLTFCVTKANPTLWADCSDTDVAGNLPATTIGHGTPTAVIDANSIDTSAGPYPNGNGGTLQNNGGDLFTQLSTNATNGAVVKVHTSTGACASTPAPSLPGGLTADGGGTCMIPPINAGAAGASALTAGVAAFGLFVTDSFTLDVNAVGSLTPTTTYNNQTNETIPNATTAGDLRFGWDTATANDNVIGNFGGTVASTSSPTYRVYNEYVFAATASLTTPAGIYTANMSMIATGTF